jgi:predicted metal-binding membrane protein
MSTTAAGPGLLDSAIRRDRLIVAAGLVALTVLAWLYIIHLSRMMSLHSTMAMPMPMDMGVPELGYLIPMWIIMMVAMMVPSAAPSILLFSSAARSRKTRGIPTASAAVFTLGYLLIWAVYASVAAVVQYKLHQQALLSPDMVSASPVLAGGLLIVAGIYQWLPIKRACLSHCHFPLGIFSHHWREGSAGALLMGVRHGSYCVGCCWALMALLFVAGVMNLLWVTAIAVFVLAEKLWLPAPTAGRLTGFLLTGWGIWVIAAAR